MTNFGPATRCSVGRQQLAGPCIELAERPTLLTVTRCDGSIAAHAAAAKKLGVTNGEVAEAPGVAINLNAGAALVYSSHVMDAMK